MCFILPGVQWGCQESYSFRSEKCSHEIASESTLRRGDHSGWCILAISSENLVENRKFYVVKSLGSLSRSRPPCARRVARTLAHTRAPPSRPRPARPGARPPEVRWSPWYAPPLPDRLLRPNFFSNSCHDSHVSRMRALSDGPRK